MWLRQVPGTLGLSLVLVAVALAAEPPHPGPPFVVPVAADGVQRATVTLDSYSYQPDHLIVEKGKACRADIDECDHDYPPQLHHQGSGGESDR